MNGSEKQIKWAEDIKTKMMPEFDNIKQRLSGNTIGIKAVDFVTNIDSAKFWIDNRSSNAMSILMSLQKGSLRLRGDEYSHTAKLEPELGIITITWNEIISDGHGGHHETKTEVIKL